MLAACRHRAERTLESVHHVVDNGHKRCDELRFRRTVLFTSAVSQNDASFG